MKMLLHPPSPCTPCPVCPLGPRIGEDLPLKRIKKMCGSLEYSNNNVSFEVPNYNYHIAGSRSWSLSELQYEFVEWNLGSYFDGCR